MEMDNVDLAEDQIVENRMLEFVDKYFPDYGFRESPGSKKTPKLKFEAISVGIHLALEEKPDLKIKSVNWLDSDTFQEKISGSSTNTRDKLVSRIEFVRDQLLYDNSHD
ncbi:MAG: hypothetical protein HC880_21250 [Bacteroidia bacterium]|nr:hypothetical protein [Bacteroidia bacterium]